MKIFENTTALAAATLTAGQMVSVKEVGEYRIKAAGASGITLANGNVAEPVASGTAVNVLQFGADPTGVDDSTAAIQAAIGAYADATTVYIPEGTYLLTDNLFLGINSKLIGAGSNVTTLSYTGTDTKIILGDAFSHVEGMRIRNDGGTAGVIGISSYTPTTANGWRNGVVRDVIINDCDYGISSSQNLTQGLMFQNVYERVRIYDAVIAVQMGAGSNANTFINCEFWRSTTRDLHLNNVTSQQFIGCGFEETASVNFLVEASDNIHFNSCYFEPVRGSNFFDNSTGSFTACHSTNFHSVGSRLVSCVNGSSATITGFTDYNIGGSSTASHAFYSEATPGDVIAVNTSTRSGTEKFKPDSTDGVIINMYITGNWEVIKYGNGVMIQTYVKEKDGVPVMSGTANSYSATRTLPEAFTSSTYAATASIGANAAANFLLIEDPTIAVRATSTTTCDVATKRTYASYVDGYWYTLQLVGRWK